MTVLIVDDHAQVRRIIRSVIADLAMEIRETGTAEEALTLCADSPPDWVLMDIQLPGLDGLAAARVIIATWPAVRVCIVTNYDDLARSMSELRPAAWAMPGMEAPPIANATSDNKVRRSNSGSIVSGNDGSIALPLAADRS